MSIWRAILTACAVLAVACQRRDYPIAPTACDDYCEARQRANCPNDDPEACVATCAAAENVGTFVAACVTPAKQLTQCLLDAPANAFYCRDSATVWLKDLCAAEEHALSDCEQHDERVCLDLCDRRKELCGGADCRCDEEYPCEEAFTALYSCVLPEPNPAECGTDPRLSTNPSCAAERAVADACIARYPDDFYDLLHPPDGGVPRDAGDAGNDGQAGSDSGIGR